MDEHFKKRYGVYDGIDTGTFKHIPEKFAIITTIT
jgi:hypothetical protein